MRRLLSLVLLLPAIMLAPLRAQEKDKDKEKQPGPVEISWHGQSFFTIKSSKGTLIAVDPHAIEVYGRPQDEQGRPIKYKADIITVSHNHPDHTQVGVCENEKEHKDLKIIFGLKGMGKNAAWNIVDQQIKDVHVRSVGVYHDDDEGLTRGKNTVFIFEVDGWRIVHLGDLGETTLSRNKIKEIGPIDVLMIPVGGVYTLNGSEAKEMVQQLKPKEYIFPMHCGTKIYDDLLPVDEFLDGVPKSRIAVSDDNKIILNRDANRPRPLIVQLHYWPKKKLEEKVVPKEKK